VRKKPVESKADVIRRQLAEQAASQQAVTADRLLSRAREEAEKWKQKYKAAVGQLEIAEQRAALVEEVEAIAKTRRPEQWELKHSDKITQASVIVGMSDWHCEESVDPKTIDGNNEFNLEIADRRIKRLFAKTIEYTDELRSKVKIDCIVLALLGDFLTGYIHEELEESNYLSPPEALYWVAERIDCGIELVASELKLPVICATANGNHGRTTKKKRI